MLRGQVLVILLAF